MVLLHCKYRFNDSKKGYGLEKTALGYCVKTAMSSGYPSIFGHDGLLYTNRPFVTFPFLSQDLIIANIILNFLIAFNACGSLAGIITISPSFKRRVLPEIIISASPSRR